MMLQKIKLAYAAITLQGYTLANKNNNFVLNQNDMIIKNLYLNCIAVFWQKKTTSKVVDRYNIKLHN